MLWDSHSEILEMAVAWKWHRDQPQLGLHPGVDVRGAAAVSCPHVQEAAHHLINLEKKNPSLRPTIITSLESEVEFISQYQEVKTDNNDGKITFVLTHSNKYILCMFPPRLLPWWSPAGEVDAVAGHWRNGDLGHQCNVVDEDHCYTSQQCLLLKYR